MCSKAYDVPSHSCASTSCVHLQLLLTRTSDTVRDLLTTPHLLDPLVDEVGISQGFSQGSVKGW